MGDQMDCSPGNALSSNSTPCALNATGLASSAFDVDGHMDYISGVTDGWGLHAFAVKMCDSNTVTAPNGTAGCFDGTGLGSGQYQHPDVSVAT